MDGLQRLERGAPNVVLLLMVLFENFHIGNCRSETKSAFALSPLRSPMLLFGAISALLVHIAGMYIPSLQDVLATNPVSWQTWAVVGALAVTVVPAIELQKMTWRFRNPQHNNH